MIASRPRRVEFSPDSDNTIYLPEADHESSGVRDPVLFSPWADERVSTATSRWSSDLRSTNCRSTPSSRNKSMFAKAVRFSCASVVDFEQESSCDEDERISGESHLSTPMSVDLSTPMSAGSGNYYRKNKAASGDANYGNSAVRRVRFDSRSPGPRSSVASLLSRCSISALTCQRRASTVPGGSTMSSSSSSGVVGRARASVCDLVSKMALALGLSSESSSNQTDWSPRSHCSSMARSSLASTFSSRGLRLAGILKRPSMFDESPSRRNLDEAPKRRPRVPKEHSEALRAMMKDHMSKKCDMKVINEDAELSGKESSCDETSPRPATVVAIATPETEEKPESASTESIEIPDSDKTTIMVRNLPNRYSQEKFLEVLKTARAEGRCGAYDFVYIPVDLKRKCNAGYGFVNFSNPADAEKFMIEFQDFLLPQTNSKKQLVLSYALLQGLEANTVACRVRLQITDVVVPEEFHPAFFNAEGDRVPMPEPAEAA